MTFPFPNLTINFGHETINAIPTSAYHITDIPLTTRLVVLYNLIYTNTHTGENINSIIPYYISDGHTNNFRANMLFPFICINDPTNPSSGCAKNTLITRGLLYKYNVIKNLNSEFIYRWINDSIVTNYGDDGRDFLSNILPGSSKMYSEGVSSVLLRIENLLDFFIALFSERIINVYPLEQYRPNIRDLPDPFNFGKNTCGRNETRELIHIYDFYRSQLLVFLRDYFNKFVMEYKIIAYEFRELPLTPITLEEFNNIPQVKICTFPIDPETLTLINDAHRENTQNYIEISNKLIGMIRPMITLHTDRETFFTIFKDVPPEHRDQFITNYAKFFHKFSFFIKDSEIMPHTALDRIIAGWGASCQNGGYHEKYIKYKLKYLNLKNTSIN